MKIMVVHDDKGNIRSAGVAGPDFAGQVHLVPAEGEKVSEVDVPELAANVLDDIEQETNLGVLVEVTERWRIDARGTVPKLVPKEGSSAI